jgi:hypothetical protein
VQNVLQVLVDADNVHRSRLVGVLSALPDDAVVVAAGSPAVLRPVAWPPGTRLLPRTGWQRADLELAAAYEPDDGPLIVVSGDGDFAHLARRHSGHVLVVSEAPAAALRSVGAVLDPVHDGVTAILAWITATSTDGRPVDRG